MANLGYIRDKLDVKFLVLYVLKQLDRPVFFEDLADMTLIDDGFGFFEFSEAAGEMVASGHIAELPGDPPTYEITDKGRSSSDGYEDRTPYSVRQAAQQAVLRVLNRARREAGVRCETVAKGENHFIARMTLADGKDEILTLEMLTVSREQAQLLGSGFKKHAETVYNEVLAALLKGPQENQE